MDSTKAVVITSSKSTLSPWSRKRPLVGVVLMFQLADQDGLHRERHVPRKGRGAAVADAVERRGERTRQDQDAGSVADLAAAPHRLRHGLAAAEGLPAQVQRHLIGNDAAGAVENLGYAEQHGPPPSFRHAVSIIGDATPNVNPFFTGFPAAAAGSGRQMPPASSQMLYYIVEGRRLSRAPARAWPVSCPPCGCGTPAPPPVDSARRAF